METRLIRKQKRPRGSGLWVGWVIESGAGRLWLYTPRGSLYRGEDGSSSGTCEVAQDDVGAGQPSLWFFERGSWCVHHWVSEARGIATYVDVSRPPLADDARVAYVDLEIDLWRDPQGGCGVSDLREFLDGVLDGVISREEAHRCLEATERTLTQLTEAGSLDSYGRSMLSAAMGSRMEPLRDLGDEELHSSEVALAAAGLAERWT